MDRAQRRAAGLQQAVALIADGGPQIGLDRFKLADAISHRGELGEGLLQGVFGESVVGREQQGMAVQRGGVTVVGRGSWSRPEGRFGSGSFIFQRDPLCFRCQTDLRMEGFCLNFAPVCQSASER